MNITVLGKRNRKRLIIEHIKIYADGRKKMMEKINRTVLKASAGTGKTYRLSLEFIANLIKGTDYRNIVVMTFTKKATAEIKERIYDFLYQIAFEEYNWQDLEKNLREIYELKDFQINKEKLQEIYFNIIRNKDEMRIYTIDGFTNRIFKNTIAPFFGIYNFETLDEEDEEFSHEDDMVLEENDDENDEEDKPVLGKDIPYFAVTLSPNHLMFQGDWSVLDNTSWNDDSIRLDCLVRDKKGNIKVFKEWSDAKKAADKLTKVYLASRQI